MRNRRTKIVATIGPASDSIDALRDLIRAGVDVFRLGLAHDPVETVIERMERIRAAGEAENETTCILIDLPGPKVRAGSFGDGVDLVAGSTVVLAAGTEASTAERIHLSYDSLAKSVTPGDILHMGDGNATLRVASINGDEVLATVDRPGTMRGRPGVHIPSERVDVSTPTDDDLTYFDAVVHAGADMVAVSFVKTARDIRVLGAEKPPRGPFIIAKIETQAAVDNLGSILDVSDGIMVARGDLGLECSLAEIPMLQKRIISESVVAGKPVITATQMLESMTTNSQPTRAEVTDVANAVLDGTSAVMLSGETAVGHDPVGVIETMDEILEHADGSFDHDAWGRRLFDWTSATETDPDQDVSTRVARAMTAAAQRAVKGLGSNNIVCITGSGATARAIAQHRPESNIIAVTDNPRTLSQLRLVWGVHPYLTSVGNEERGRVDGLLSELRQTGLLERGELVPILAGRSNSSLVSDVLRAVTVS